MRYISDGGKHLAHPRHNGDEGVLISADIPDDAFDWEPPAGGAKVRWDDGVTTHHFASRLEVIR